MTTGDFGACASTAINIALTIGGELVVKIAGKYLLRLKLAKALISRAKGLVTDLIDSIKTWRAQSKIAKAAKAVAGCLVGANSFTPDTPVRMADGTSKPIEDVRVGDKVTATDPTTGTTSAQPVTALHINQDTDLADLTIHTPEGHTDTLHTTWHHPFWDTTTRQWVDAANLQPGHQLRGTDAGVLSTILAVKIRVGSHQMRNLTVSAIHTYYVIAGTTPVLVHNTSSFCGPDASALAHWDAGTFKSVEESAVYHLDKHGKGRSFAEYTQEAKDLWDNTKSENRVPWKLMDGRTGWKIRGGLRGGEGIYTQEGKIVTWHD